MSSIPFISSSLANELMLSCQDILTKNLGRTDEKIYILYDLQSPLAKIVERAYRDALSGWENVEMCEFLDPPAPLYRGGLINPKNPHNDQEKRIMSDFNKGENQSRGFDHEQTQKPIREEQISEEVENIKNKLLSLEAGSIVVLIQSSNFRLSTFRIRLELFARGVHVVEHNHLSYIGEAQFETFIQAHRYETPYYVSETNRLSSVVENTSGLSIISKNGSVLQTGPLERMRGNTGDYSRTINKGGTFPLGEVFSEAKDLSSLNGTVMIDTYPTESFMIDIVAPFALTIENGKVLPSSKFPEGFQKLYDIMCDHEGEVMVREIGFGLNRAISTQTPLSDVNFHERKHGIHLSLGKKHGIYGKKLPKDMLQRYHIDVFVDLSHVETPEHGVIFPLSRD